MTKQQYHQQINEPMEKILPTSNSKVIAMLLLAILAPSSLLAVVRPFVLSIAKQGTNIVVTVQPDLQNVQYVIQASDTLGANANWTPVWTNFVNGSDQAFQYTNYNAVATYPKRFYRAYR